MQFETFSGMLKRERKCLTEEGYKKLSNFKKYRILTITSYCQMIK